jgi:hypothetical protein
MRVVSLFRKTMIENIRDWKILILTLSFAPFFVALMYFYTADTTTTYRIIVVNHDEGDMGQGLIAAITDIRSPDGSPGSCGTTGRRVARRLRWSTRTGMRRTSGT